MSAGGMSGTSKMGGISSLKAIIQCNDTWRELDLDLGLEILLIKRMAWLDTRNKNSMSCLT